MKQNNMISYTIDSAVLKKYVETINSIKYPMNQIKTQLNQLSDSIQKLSVPHNEELKTLHEKLDNINKMSSAIKTLLIKFPNDKTKLFIDTIKQISKTNNGMITTRMIEPLNISRRYLSIAEHNNDIEKVSRGIYLLPSAFEDSYFSFQQKYKRAIFSHMNALYFHGMTEEFPYNYTVTVPQNYHTDKVNEKCNVFYASDDIYNLGIVEIKTPNGNKVRTYDKEKCICDIIRSKERLDPEQVKKTIKQYIQCQDKNLAKLSEYSKKMGISEKVMEMIGDAYYA